MSISSLNIPPVKIYFLKCTILCYLQELEDTFEVRVKNEINELLKLCKNMVVVCSKSGKLHIYILYNK